MERGAAFARLGEVLVATLLGDLDAEVRALVRRDLLARVQSEGVRDVILDLSALSVIDLDDFGHLAQTLEMAHLLGARALLVGLSAPVAATLAELGAPIDRVEGEATVERALERLRPRAS
jgi:anti-anti-sigma factor